MVNGWPVAMDVFQTRTESFSNWGVRTVDLGGCGVAEPLTPKARSTSQRVFRMAIGCPSPRRCRDGRADMRASEAKRAEVAMREELSRRDLCRRLVAGGVAAGLGGSGAPATSAERGGSDKTIALLLFPE